MNIFKRLNQYLISNHPVIWNTKAAYILPLAIIINILFYCFGYLGKAELTDLKSYLFIDEGILWSFSFLVSVLLIIVWLVFYLRNSAVKNLYPVSKAKTVMEFLIIIVVFFSIITFGYSWVAGKHHKYQKIIANIDIPEAINKYNIAHHFLATNLYAFEENNSCNYNNDVYEEVITTTETGAEVDTTSIHEIPNPSRSYLNYCSMAFTDPFTSGITDRYIFNKKANEYLINGNKEAVKEIIRDYLAICDLFKIDYRLPVDEYVNLIFSTPDFQLVHIRNVDIYQLKEINSGEFYISKGLETVFEQLINYRTNFFTWDHLMVMIYISIALAYLLMTFRLSRLKEWFFSIIGAGVVMIIISIISAAIDQFYPILFSFWIAFVLFSIISIFQKRRKKISAFTFNWFIWFLPLLIPLILAFLLELSPSEHPVKIFLEEYDYTIVQLNLIAIILYMVFIVIPLAYKWHANPEE